jgi:putative nucleotidyltransferase with HDIG domain
VTKVIDLPNWPWQTVCQTAEERDVRVWPVGGAVRDALLGRPVHDWDFAVDRDAMRLARAVADALGGAYYPLDEERDTGRVVLVGRDGVRVDLDFAAQRGGSLETDLLARDFTVNALALDGTGVVIDVARGLDDLEAGFVRAVSDQAFQDDPLRLLRAVRLEADLGFQIEPKTAAWMQRDADLLTGPSAERVRDEFVRIFSMSGAATSLERLDEFGLLSFVLPEMESLKGVKQSPPHRHDVWRHTLVIVDVLEGVVAVATGQETEPVLADVPQTAWGDLVRVLGQFASSIADHLAVEVSSGRDRTQLLKLATLLHDVGKPKTQSKGEGLPGEADGRIHFYNHDLVGAQIAAARLQELRFSRDEVERVRTIVGAHLRPAHLACIDDFTRRAIYRFFRATSCGGVDVILLALADHLATWGPDLREERWARRLEVAETLLTHWFDHYQETIEPPPLVTGGELIAELGLEPGPQVGRLLRTLQEAQAAGEVRSREEALALARRVAKGRNDGGS